MQVTNNFFDHFLGVKVTYCPNQKNRSAHAPSKQSTTIEAEAVICTIPLGNLKRSLLPVNMADSIKFEPPLPAWKTKAINNMGYGSLNKVKKYRYFKLKNNFNF